MKHFKRDALGNIETSDDFNTPPLEPGAPAQAAPAAAPAQATEMYDAGGMTLQEFIDLMASHIVALVVSLVLGAAIAFAGTYFFITPQYQATSKVYVVSASSSSVVNLSDLQIGSSLAKDYKELLLVRPLLEDLSANLGLSYTPEQLKDKISITTPSDTRILQISVLDPDPQLAADIANEMVNLAMAYLPRIMESDEPNVAESAVVPTAKYSPSYSQNTLIGGLAGLFLCAAVIIVRSMLDDSLVTPTDVQNFVGIPPLATIPETRMRPTRPTEGAKGSMGPGSSVRPNAKAGGKEVYAHERS